MNIFSLLASSDFGYLQDAAKPLYTLLNSVIPILIGLGCGVLLVLAIVKFVVASKAEDDGEAAKKRKQGIWCIVTMVICAVLVAVYMGMKDALLESVEGLLTDGALVLPLL